MSNPARAYLTTQVETRTQGELLLMLYEAAIKFLKRAKIEIENRDYAQKGIYISKAMDVINELSESLNKEKGGEIAKNLHSLYVFCVLELTKANIRMNTKKIDNVIDILDGIRSAYAQIVPQEEAKGGPPLKAPTLSLRSEGFGPDPNEKASVPPPAPKEEAAAQSAPVRPAPTAVPPLGMQQVPPQAKRPVNAVRLRAATAYGNTR